MIHEAILSHLTSTLSHSMLKFTMKDLSELKEDKSDKAGSYYTTNRKYSFFYPRVTVLVSMIILVITLVINIIIVYKHDKTSIQSQASTSEITQSLAAIPHGCSYQQTQQGLKVVCPQPTLIIPTDAATCHPGMQSGTMICVDKKKQPQIIQLPILPKECRYVTIGTKTFIDCQMQ
jgi:preprotein translocase subunit SecG